MTEVLAVLAATWAVIMGLAPLLQLRRMVQRGSAADVSIGYLLILLPGFGLWIAYGVSATNLALVVPNAVGLLVASITTGYAVRLRRSWARSGSLAH
ncbi:uncharacterized protein with PQ loop repeat [Microbacterium trichothecenolyticum]|uniref:SemiSWEET family transporter n=1 Tax=Microbacterium trichothecenolyticum TaxID=69370 RepID=UPI002856EEB2|nr:SemiSWEET family transporter [Microbacterium trichothecenolyticum]MDR7187168.1 uncharacterized protein with PQ loop repeat [Microbacterium trichothecenolyticum]